MPITGDSDFRHEISERVAAGTAFELDPSPIRSAIGKMLMWP